MKQSRWWLVVQSSLTPDWLLGSLCQPIAAGKLPLFAPIGWAQDKASGWTLLSSDWSSTTRWSHTPSPSGPGHDASGALETSVSSGSRMRLGLWCVWTGWMLSLHTEAQHPPEPQEAALRPGWRRQSSGGAPLEPAGRTGWEAPRVWKLC